MIEGAGLRLPSYVVGYYRKLPRNVELLFFHGLFYKPTKTAGKMINPYTTPITVIWLLRHVTSPRSSKGNWCPSPKTSAAPLPDGISRQKTSSKWWVFDTHRYGIYGLLVVLRCFKVHSLFLGYVCVTIFFHENSCCIPYEVAAPPSAKSFLTDVAMFQRGGHTCQPFFSSLSRALYQYRM